MTAEPLDDDYRMPLNPKPRYCSQCDNKVGEDETLCLGCLEDEDAEEADAGDEWPQFMIAVAEFAKQPAPLTQP
jgi:hypothetical protein